MVDLCEDGVDVHAGTVLWDVHLDDVLDYFALEKGVAELGEGLGCCALAVADQEVVFVDGHDVTALDGDGLVAGNRLEEGFIAHLEDFFIGF